jgi:Nif-specific regulatory protein
MANLVLLKDGAPHVRFVLGDRSLLGRSSRCDVQILDPRLSRRHAELRRQGQTWWLEDLGSRNGTERGGAPVRDPVRLQPGDRLALGGLEALFDPPLELLHARAGGASVCLVDVEPGEVLPKEPAPAEALGAADLRAVHRLTCELVAQLDLERLLPELLGRLCDHFGADRGFVLLRDGPQGRLRPAATRGGGSSLAISRTLVDRVLESGEPVMVRNALEDVSFEGARSVAAHGLRSVMVAPLAADEEVLGLLQLDRKEAAAFGPADLGRLTEMARVAARAVRGARQVDLERRRHQALSVRAETQTRFVGGSAAVRQLLAVAQKAAAADARVLVTGESGTGKELVARLLHEQGPRAAGPWVALNCAAIAPTLLESELFGHEKGAFTGAARQHRGCFELADGGTLFLDEIGEIDPATQVRLLRVLQEGAFFRVGGEKPLQVDVRVVAATNRDLEARVAAGQFREDLFYRLNVVHLRIPPLRERPEDVPELLEHFVGSQARELGRPVPALDAAARELLERYRWPGNVRELQNVVERLLVLLDGDTVRVADLPPEITLSGAEAPRPGRAQTLREVLAETERELVVRALRETRGRKARACRLLGISRPTLDKKIRDYDIEL